MEKIIKLFHVERLNKESIFNAYNNISSFKSYIVKTEKGDLFSDNAFWQGIKDYCNGSNRLIECESDGHNCELFVLVNLDWFDEKEESDQPLDYVCIQYLLALVSHLKNNYMVCFYSNHKESHASSNYYRLSAFLNLWLSQNKKRHNFRYLDTFSDICNGNDNYNPKRFAYSFLYDTPSETLLPIISLNRRMYRCLDQPYNISRKKQSLNSLLKKIKNITDDDTLSAYYEEYIYQAINKLLYDVKKEQTWIDLESNFLSSSPSLIVVYIYAIIKNHIEYSDFLDLTFQSLVEKSFDYAHGLMQLIENSIKHVIEQTPNSCAFFSIRMHHIVGDLNHYLNDTSFKNLKYFLEISVLDCTPNLENSGIVSKYNETLIKSSLTPIGSLSDIFEYPFGNSSSLTEYYSNAANVANHYGLQIFDTILTSNNGLFIVQSGSSSLPDIYTNAKKICLQGKHIYNVETEDLRTKHFSGTSYTIILPINKSSKEFISSQLSLCNTPLKLNSLFQETTSISLMPVKLKSNKKEDFVEKYIEIINGMFTSNKSGILALNISEISKTRIGLELLCKSIISIISNQQNENLNVICLLGVCDEYRLLDAVRLIALFYDKTGHCDFIKNKGIYLSCEKNYDILFSGNDIRAVLENIERQRLIKNLPETFYKHIVAALKDRIIGEN